MTCLLIDFKLITLIFTTDIFVLVAIPRSIWQHGQGSSFTLEIHAP